MTPEQLRKLLHALRTTDKTEIDLSMFEIDDAQAIEIAEALRHSPNIKKLNLWKNNIGDEGATALAANHTLTSLDLDKNNIGMKELQHLQQTILLLALPLIKTI